MESFKSKNYKKALEDIYLLIDEHLQTPKGKEKLKTYQKKNGNQGPFGRGGDSDDIAMSAGCTACSALITPTTIYVVNAGDSRAVIGMKATGGRHTALEMSEDHKPDNSGEKARIEKAGGFVEDNRVKGVLALSRSIGDLEYKQEKGMSVKDQMITADPEIKEHQIKAGETNFLIVACDGIWDCMTNQEAVDFVSEIIQKKPKLSQVVEDMFDKIIASDVASSGGIGCDNMTCVIVQFK
jgi:serine/threonine protein phosphatase PrpC